MKKSILLLMFISAFMACSQKEKLVVKPYPLYYDVDTLYQGEPFKIYINLNMIGFKDEEFENIECMLYYSSTDEQVRKAYKAELHKVPNNDSLIYTEFVNPSDVNQLFISIDDKNKKNGFSAVFQIKNKNNIIVRNSNSFRLQECESMDTILKYIDLERKSFPYNYHDYVNVFMLYNHRKDKNVIDSVQSIINKIQKEVSLNPPKTISDKIDYYSFMAMAYAFIHNVDESINYLKILQSDEFRNSELRNSSGICNISRIFLFYLKTPSTSQLSKKEKALIVECVKVGFTTNSKVLFNKYIRFFNNKDICENFLELAEQFNKRALELLNLELDKNAKYCVSNYSNLYSNNHIFIKKPENLAVYKKLLKELKVMIYSTPFSKDTNDYYCFPSIVNGNRMTMYNYLANYYESTNELDSLKNLFFDAEKVLGLYNEIANGLRSMSWQIKDLYLDKNEIDSATKYYIKGLEYHFIDSKYFKDAFDKLNKAREANKYPELDYTELTKSLRPKSVDIKSLELPKEISFLNNAKDSVIFFITIDDYCKICNADAANINKTLNAKIKGNAKIAYYLLSDHNESELKNNSFDSGFKLIKKSDSIMKFFRLDSKETANMAVYKSGRIVFIDMINSDPSYIENLINKDL